MAESSWPYPDPANANKRIVTDVQFEALYHPATTDGLLGSPSDASLVYGDDSGMQVKVRPSREAVLRGHGWASDVSGKTLTIAANSSGSTRVDLVVLRLTRSTWQVTTEVRQGTPGSGAPSPVTDLGTTGVYEIVLAEVSIPTGDTSIAAAQVTNRAWYVGSDGQLLCEDSATRPPPERGRTIWERSTARQYVSDGTNWTVTREDSGWVNVTPASGWSVAGGGMIKVRRHNGAVYLLLALQKTGGALAAGADSILGTLTSDYRPDSLVPVLGYLDGGNLARLQVSTDGTVIVTNYNVSITSGGFLTAHVASWPKA